MRFDTAALLNRVSRLREAQRDLLSTEFDQRAAALLGDAALKGGVGGTAFRQVLRQLCATELHERVEADLRALLAAHKAMSAPPAAHVLVACKEWLAKRIAEDALDLTRHLSEAA